MYRRARITADINIAGFPVKQGMIFTLQRPKSSTGDYAYVDHDQTLVIMGAGGETKGVLPPESFELID